MEETYMKNTVTKSMVILLISFSISILAFIIFDLKIGSFTYLFVYLLSLLLIPYWLNNNNINWKSKLSLTILVGIISSMTIIYTYGISRTLQRYAIILGVVVIFCIGSNYIKNKKLRM
jgi:hypothetical protein